MMGLTSMNSQRTRGATTIGRSPSCLGRYTVAHGSFSCIQIDHGEPAIGHDTIKRRRRRCRLAEERSEMPGKTEVSDVLAFGTALLLGLSLPVSTYSQDRYWEPSGAGAPNGGNGTWDTSSASWADDTLGSNYFAWNNVTFDTAWFLGNNYTITLAEPIVVGGIISNAAQPTLTGSTLTFNAGGATPIVNLAPGRRLRIESDLLGTDGLQLDGDGLLFLSGTKSLTGGITINGGEFRISGSGWSGTGPGVTTVNNGGTLILQVANALGSSTTASDLVISDGGALRFTINQTHDFTLTGGSAFFSGTTGRAWTGTAALTADTSMVVGFENESIRFESDFFDNGAVLSIATNNNVTTGITSFSGNLSHTGGVTVDTIVGTSRTGGIALTGTNSYAGGTNVDEGHLYLRSAGALSPNSNTRIGSVGIGILALGSGNESFTNSLGTGNDQVQFIGSGGFVSDATAAGPVTVDLGGTAAPLTWGAGNFVPDGQALHLGVARLNTDQEAIDFVHDIDLGASQRTIVAHNLDTGDSDAGELSGVLSGTGGLFIDGWANPTGATLTDAIRNTLRLSGANTYTGTTSIGDAMVVLDDANALPGGVGLTGGVSNLDFAGGVISLTAPSGDFERGLGTGGDQVQWTGAGGFTAEGGDRAVNISGAGGVLTWGAGNFVPDGSTLLFGGRAGDSAVNFENAIDLGGLARTIEVNRTRADIGNASVRLNGVISGAGDLRFESDTGGNTFGNGTARLTANNTFTGDLILGVGNVRVQADSVADAGTASAIGAGAAVIMNNNTRLIYTGAANGSTDRTLELLGANTYLSDAGTGGFDWTGAVTKTTAGGGTLRLDAGDVDDPTALSQISGVIGDGAGTVRVQTEASAQWRLTGANTYTGRTTLSNASVLEVANLADGGVASSVGASANGANNLLLLGGSTLRYVGAGDTTDRLFRVEGAAQVASSGTGALEFTNTGSIRHNAATSDQLVLGGSNTDDNLFAPVIDESLNTNVNRFESLRKEGIGLWALTGDNNALARGYRGNTVIGGGVLRIDNAGAISGGLGATSSHGPVGSSERSSLIEFEGGVIGLTAASGDFLRGTTTAGTSLISNNGTAGNFDDDTYVHGVFWDGDGGFAAFGGTRTVNLGGAGAGLTWANSVAGSNGFVAGNNRLLFGNAVADGTVDFVNPINVTTDTNTTVDVADGAADIDAVFTGVISGGGLAQEFVKDGAGTLSFAADNTYSHDTRVAAGTLQVGTGGTVGRLGTGGEVAIDAGATLAFNRSDTYAVDNAVNGAGTLSQTGTGTTRLNAANTSAGVTVVAAGTLEIAGIHETPTVDMSDDTTFGIDGTLQAAGPTQTVVTGSAGVNAVFLNAGGTLLASGNLGDGADSLQIAGAFDSGAGSFELAGGDDTLTLRDGATLAGLIDGGTQTGADTVVVDNTAAVTFDDSNVTNFEILQKDNVGTLTLTGTQGFVGGTLLNGGTLAVDGALATPMVAMGDGSTLQVDGTLDDGAAGQAAVTGSAGANTINIAAGGTLLASGDLGDGADVLDVAGTLDTGAGTLGLGLGDDTFRITDGTVVTGIVDGGAGTDTFNTDINTVASVSATLGLETLTKTGAGLLNLTGPAASSFDTVNVNAGTVDVDGGIDGVGAATVLAGATLNLDGPFTFTNGADNLTVAGTVAGTSAIDMRDGDDLFTFQEGADVSAPVDGGAGSDTLTADILTSGSLIQATNFETLTKAGGGILNITGPGVSDFSAVNVDAGTLDVAAAGSIVDVSAATVAAGATLDVDGAFLFTPGDDTFDVSGAVTGAGTLDMLAGDDVLTLNDGTDLSGLVNAIDGGTEVGADTVVVDDTAAVTFDDSNVTNFEILQKDNVGTLTLTGTQGFVGGTLLNGGTLAVDGALATPTVAMGDGSTLQVDGTLDDGAAGQAAVTGSAGANTINVAAGGTLLALGNLGDGADVLDVAGTLDTGAGALDLGLGDDTFRITDGTVVTGIVDGGAGTDVFNPDIATAADIGATTGFETLTKTGVGVLNITGPGVSEFSTVNVNAGTLDVAAAGSIVDVSAATVAAGATLDVDGAFLFTPGDDTFDVSGAVTTPIDLLDGDDVVTVSATGNITGDTVLGLGNDVFNLAGGISTGDLYGDGTTADSADGDDVFNWTGGDLAGGFFGGNGSDTTTIASAALYDGSQILDGGDDVSAADGWSDTLVFSDFNGIVGAGTLINWENVTVEGGSITFAGGALTVGSEAGLGLTLNDGVLLNAGGGFALTGNLINSAGVIDAQDGSAGDTVTISGDYVGGGQFRTDVDFTADTADVLSIGGSVVSGNTLIVVNDVSTGEATGNDILVVDVSGTAAADAFSSASVISGAVTYDLQQIDQDFFLSGTSTGFSPLAPVYEAYPQALRALNRLPSLQQRVGQRRWAVVEQTILDADKDGINDDADLCPDTDATVTVDEHGCQRMVTQQVKVVLEVNFAHDSSQLLSGSSQEIEKLARFMRKYADTTVVVEGHTSAAGSESYNQSLSERRAGAIVAQLTGTYGVAAERVSAKGYGESRLKVMETSPEDEALNRRVVAAISTTETTPSLEERLADNPDWLLERSTDRVRRHGLWTRIEGEEREQESVSSTSATDYDLSRSFIQIGYDFPLVVSSKGTLVGGIAVHYTEADVDAFSPVGDGNIDSRGYGTGLTATWYGRNQAYIDVQAQFSRYETDLSASLDPTLASDLDGDGWAFSVEVGKRYQRDGWGIVPQAQISYDQIDFDGFADGFGSDVSLNEGRRPLGRLGIAVDRNRSWIVNGAARRSYLYGVLNLSHQFEQETEVDVSGTSLMFEEDAWTADVGIGGSYEWNDGRATLFGEVLVRTGLENFGNSTSVTGTIGIRTNF